jgi:cell wall-associated NlpC family hydrolase
MGTAVKAALGTTAGLLLLVITGVVGIAGIAGIAGGTASGIPLAGTLLPSRAALADVPARMLSLYQQAAATCPGLPWTVLAAIGKAETDHARNPHQISPAGAVGPMQFEPATFAAYANPVPPGGQTPPTPWDPVDAVYAAARLLCAGGARDGRNLRGAVLAFNHDPVYADQVLHTAATYTSGLNPPAGPGGALRVPTAQAAIAILYAHAQLGRPYTWGGTGQGGAGFDCSGLTQAAYAAAGILLPRVAQDQYNAGPHLPAGAPLLPGDLVFYGTPHHVHHVALYTGAGHMIDAPHPGALVRQEPLQHTDLLGATRPTAPSIGTRS